MGRAHKRDCPLSSRHLYGSCTLFSGASDSGTVPEVSSGSTQLGKHEGPSDVKPSMAVNPPLPVSKSVTMHVCVLAGWTGSTSHAVWMQVLSDGHLLPSWHSQEYLCWLRVEEPMQ